MMSDRDGYLHRRDQLLMQDEQIAGLEQQLADLRIHASHYKAAEDKDKPIIAEVMVSELIG